MEDTKDQFLAELDKELTIHPFREPYKTALRDGIGLLVIAAIVYFMLGPNSVWPLFILIAIMAGVLHPIRSNRITRRRRAIVVSGVPVQAVIVQANKDMFRKGFEELPCEVLFSFDKALNENPSTLINLADKVYALKGTKPSKPDEYAVSKLVTNELAVRHRRRLLPPSFTGDRVVYAADLFIESRFLRDGYLTDRVLPCFAEEGDTGGIELVPYSLLKRLPL